ncbi:immunoglobulin superfamily member 1-like [Macrotis lagotis]|uniref:immunoglobulin superfamily member 1-like n=1 Tax=Macrotis lagotis TaxID=92651 RepID=UPI003D69A5EF
MGPTVTFLVSTVLCLDWATRAQMDTLARPTLWAVPGPVVSKGANVTLKCQGHLGCDRLQLWKDGKLKEERNASWELAEFVLHGVDDWKDASSYNCRCGQGHWWSQRSEPLVLVVIRESFPPPSIEASHQHTVFPGTTVTIKCKMSTKYPAQDYRFALLKAKSWEPLETQNPTGGQAEFSLHSLRAEDSGSYSCIYYKKTAPHRASRPSYPLELTVMGRLPKPTLWAQPGLVMGPGVNLTLWCSRPKLYTQAEVTFTLWKTGTQKTFQLQTSADLWTSFLLPSVGSEDTGSYSCAYSERTNSARESEPSDALELVVPGSLPRPSLSALPDLVVMPGTHVTLQCRLPPWSSLWRVTFSLLKVGTPLPLQSQNLAGTFADFPLLSVGPQDAGIYSCVYYGRMPPYQVSEASEALEIWVTGVRTKPSISVWPGLEVASGADVTLLCWGPSQNRSFVLYKERDGNILQSMDTTKDGARFFLAHVTPKDSGNYSCGYQVRINGSIWTQHSDPLQLIVQGSKSSKKLIITLSCVSLLLFLLCLLLLAFLYKRSITSGSFQGESRSRWVCCPCHPLSICPSQHPGNPRDAVISPEVTKGRSKQPLIPMNEEPQGVTYAQLNINVLSERKNDSTKTSRGSIVYATVSKD